MTYIKIHSWNNLWFVVLGRVDANMYMKEHLSIIKLVYQKFTGPENVDWKEFVLYFC